MSRSGGGGGSRSGGGGGATPGGGQKHGQPPHALGGPNSSDSSELDMLPRANTVTNMESTSTDTFNITKVQILTPELQEQVEFVTTVTNSMQHDVLAMRQPALTSLGPPPPPPPSVTPPPWVQRGREEVEELQHSLKAQQARPS
jgi:hypothetical protein